jgi:energy-coupling factor transport system ATP-binding protein
MDGMLDIQNLSFAYPGEENRALDRINLHIDKGEFIVLCGKSGCGKSTLLCHLKPPLTPHGKRKGDILFADRPIQDLSNRDQAKRIGFVLQNPDNQIVTDKVWHELAFGLESLGYKTRDIRIRVAEMASYFGIQDWFYRNVDSLSGGQKQLLNLASIMAMHPDLLVLDEPTSQLDPIAASDFLETVKKINRDLGTTIILTEHRLEEVFPSADRVVVMDHGRIYAEGTPMEIGKRLREDDHEMFTALPAPMQIYARTKTRQELPCPITVRDGRKWLDLVCEERSIPAFRDREESLEASIKDNFQGEREDKGHEIGSEQTDAARSDSHVHSRNKKIITESRSVLLEGKDLWFRYDKELPDVVKGLSIQIREGEFYCLLGGNGTGKSTTLSLLSRLRTPYRGKILLEGKDLRKYKSSDLFRGCLGVLPQNPQSLFVKKTVEEELYEMIGGRKEKKDASWHLAMDKEDAVMGIADLTHLSPYLKRHPYDLSGGEQQRLALAKILLLRPRLLLMDEPTKGLDAYFKQEFAHILEELRAHGVTIFMISHDIEFCAAHADRCGLFFDGNVVADGTPGEFFAGNNFYTTAANRMAREYFPEAVTGKDVVACLNQWIPQTR